MPRAEVVLWYYIKSSQLNGYKFRRQQSIGPFVVDFYCPSAKLAIELDGDSHYQIGAFEEDTARTKYIESFGIRIIRFTNLDIHNDLEEVLKKVKDYLTTPYPSLKRRG